jgi:peptidyl-prolyl cis-trans isomerase D
MLDKLRANKGGLVTWLFLVAIIAVFILYFGPGSFAKTEARGGCGAAQASYAARVNGKTILVTDLQRQLGQLRRMFQQQTGQPITREMVEQYGLANVALDQVVSRELVVQEARRRGLAVTDDELLRQIESSPDFQQGGRFDPALYKRATRASFGSDTRYESLLRTDMLHQKMLAAVRETVKVSDAEIRSAWQNEHDRAAISYLKIPLAAARAEVKPTDAEVKAFAASQGGRIEKFYAENASRYDTQKKVRARHVLARVPPGAPASADEAARKRIEAAAERVAKGEDFAKVAAEVSDDENTKAKGGELGFLVEALLEKPFAEAAFALAPGQVSAPVRTASGWHLVQVEEVVPPKKIPLADVRLDIARELLAGDRATKVAAERARAALDGARKGDRKPVKLGGQTLSWSDTPTFSVVDAAFVPGAGTVPGLVEDARGASTGDVLPRVYETPDGPVVAVVKTRERPDPSRYEAEKPGLALRVEVRKEQQVERAWMKSLRDGADVRVNEPVVAAVAAGSVQQE